MEKRILSILLTALMIFGGSLAAFSETESTQEPGFPMVELIPGIDHTNDLIGPVYVNNQTGVVDNGYVKITPLGGNLIKVHYYNPYYLLDEEDEEILADLNSIYYKAAQSVFKVSFNPVLALDETAVFELGIAPHKVRNNFRPAVSHISTFDMNFTPRTQIYGLISGVKLGENENPIEGMSFDFEIYYAEDTPGVDNPVATATSDPLTGVMTFNYFGDSEDFNELKLEPGMYKIFEVNLPVNYEFMHFIILDGGNVSDPESNGATFEIVNSSTFIIFNAFNRMKDSQISAFKYDAAKEGDSPFADVTFDFELWFEDELFAIGKSQTNGEIKFFKVDEMGQTDPEDMGLSSLTLLYGNYVIKEINIPSMYKFVKYAVIVDDEETVWSNEEAPPIIEFMAGDANEIIFKFYNEKIIEYNEDTAYAYPGLMPGGTLESVTNSNNWGWYISTPVEGVFEIYAGAGQNDITKGIGVGDVNFFVNEEGYYDYELLLNPNVEVTDGPHFGVYASTDDIPNGPGQYSNTVLAENATVLVLHLVVKYPME